MTKERHHPASGHHHDHGAMSAAPFSPAAAALVKDPVCGMTVDPRTAKHRADHSGETYYFCSAGCRTKFEADPERYVPAVAAAAAKTDPSACNCGHDHHHTDDHADHGHEHANHDRVGHAGHGAAARSASHMVKDPVCGMDVDPHTAEDRADYHGRAYYLCSARCREKFMAEPEKYLAPEQAHAEEVPEGTIYTCPMHPEVRQVGPGHCPICGMALEPVLATAETGPNPELIDMTRRFWVGLVLALPVLALEMGGEMIGLTALLGKPVSNWVQLVFATPVVLWGGWPFFVRGWNSVVARSLNMFTLIALGTGVAWLFSVVATVAPGLFPPAFRGPYVVGGATGAPGLRA